MTHAIHVSNVNHAFADAWYYLRVAGVQESSRNGKVLVAPTPVITVYANPTERVLFNAKRDANCVFHLMEALWMLAGRSNIEWLAQFSSNISTYAETDGNIHGAYGRRWRTWFGVDQLRRTVDILRSDPTSRQAVMQMWDPTADLHGDWRDRPCNTAIYFDCRGKALNMTVTCRSNDILWGCYGANVVHFSVLQEAIAHAVGVPVGVYRQFSNNWHAYLSNEQVQHFLANPPSAEQDDQYVYGSAHVVPLLAAGETLDDLLDDCTALMAGKRALGTAFMRGVAAPLRDAYLARKAGEDYDLDSITHCDWKLAFQQWCDRRNSK